MARGGGTGGRVRFRSGSATNSQSDSLHGDVNRRRNLTGGSLFRFINSGCFFHRAGEAGKYCPSRLTDYRCVMWTEGSVDEEGGVDEPIALGAAAPMAGSAASNRSAWKQQQASAADQPSSWDIECSGDFYSQTIRQIDCFLPLALLILGTLTNCVGGRLSLTYSGRQLPVCLYLTVLACTDTALLWSRCLDLWLQSALEVKLNLTLALLDESACQLINLAYSSLHHFKSLLQVALAVDTCRLVRQPFNRVNRYSREWVKNSAILACVLVALFNAHHLWTLTIVKQSPMVSADSADGILHCGWTERWPITDTFTDWLWPIGDLLVGDVIPVGLTLAFSLVSLCCVIIGRKRNRCRQFRHDQQEEQKRNLLSHYVIDSELYSSMQMGLLACCFGYAVLYLPPALHNCLLQLHYHQLRSGRHPHQQRQQQSDWLQLGGHNRASIEQIDSEFYIYLSRLLTSLQLCLSPIILLAVVPRFRQDFLGLSANGCLRIVKLFQFRQFCPNRNRGLHRQDRDIEISSRIREDSEQGCRDPMLVPPPPPPLVL